MAVRKQIMILQVSCSTPSEFADRDAFTYPALHAGLLSFNLFGINAKNPEPSRLKGDCSNPDEIQAHLVNVVDYRSSKAFAFIILLLILS